jgi:hypothetical protein
MTRSCGAPGTADARLDECRDGETPRLSRVLKDIELKRILSVLASQGGNQRRAAEVLGIRPTTLNEKLKRFGVMEQVRELRVQPSMLPPKEEGEIFHYRGHLKAGETLEVFGEWQAVDVAASWGDELEVRVVRDDRSPSGPPTRAHLLQLPYGLRIVLPRDSVAPWMASPPSLSVLLPQGARLLTKRSVGRAETGAPRGAREEPR